MNIDEAISLLSQGYIDQWNKYRTRHQEWIPDFRNRDLRSIQLIQNTKVEGKSGYRIIKIDLENADLRGAQLPSILEYFPENFPASKYFNLSGALIDVNTTNEDNLDLTQFGAKFVVNSELTESMNPSLVRVFISYAWANEEVILAIEQWLRKKGLDTKLDRRDFFAGSRIRDEILRIMSTCEIILIFLSSQSKDKPWTQFERELAADLEMSAKKTDRKPPRIIYIVIDETPLPSISEQNRIAIMAKGKRFELVCEEIYHSILQIPRTLEEVDLSKWSNYIF